MAKTVAQNAILLDHDVWLVDHMEFNFDVVPAQTDEQPNETNGMFFMGHLLNSGVSQNRRTVDFQLRREALLLLY